MVVGVTNAHNKSFAIPRQSFKRANKKLDTRSKNAMYLRNGVEVLQFKLCVAFKSLGLKTFGKLGR